MAWSLPEMHGRRDHVITLFFLPLSRTCTSQGGTGIVKPDRGPVS